MKTAVSSYSFQQYIKQGRLTQLSAIAEAARLGFEGIEFTDLKPDVNATPTYEEQMAYAKELRREVDRCGIKIVGYMIGANLYQGSEEANAAEVERLKGQVDLAAEMGALLMRHDVCYSQCTNGRVTSFDKMLPTIAEGARQVTEYAASKGVRTCTENHGLIAQDADRVEKLFNAVDHENYGLLVDMGNFACADEDSIRAVSRLAPYAIHAHAKDFKIHPFGTVLPEGSKSFLSRGCNRLEGCALGDGDIPARQCIAILKKAGYDGYVTIEFEGNGDCLTEIEKGIARLKEYIAE